MTGSGASDDCLAAAPAPVRLSRQGQFLLRELTGDWGGRARAGLVLVAGEGWRTSQPEPESESQSQEKAATEGGSGSGLVTLTL